MADTEISVKVDLDDQDAWKKINDLQNGDYEVKLNINVDNILKGIQTLQKRLQSQGLDLKLNLDTDKIAEKISKGASKPVKNAGAALAKELIDEFSVVDKQLQEQIKSLSKSMMDIYSTSGDYDTDAFTKSMTELAQTVISGTNVIRERTGIYDEFYDTLKKLGTIKISDAIKNDLGDDWNTLRQLYPNKFSTSKGIEMDSIYQELSSKFKDLFSGQVNPTEQFKELCAAIQLYRTDVAKIEPLDAKALGLEDSVFESIIAGVQRLNAAMKETGAQESAKEIKEEAASMKEVEKTATTAASQKEKFADANKEVKESAGQTANAVDQEQTAMMNLNNINSIIANVNMQGQRGTSVFQQFGSTLNEAFMAYTGANLLQDALHKIVEAGKEAVDTVKELNDIGTDLQMATGADRDTINQYMVSYNDLGKEIGATTTEVALAADEWLRQGHSVAETNTLIQDSMMLSKIAQLDSADSTTYLTSAMKGYNVAANDVVGIVDKLVNVDMSAAVSAGGLAEGMSRVAVTANTAGVSMDRLLGYLAVVGETTQRDMSSVGNSFKTIFQRMSDIKAGKFKLIDEDGTEETLSDVEQTLANVGIDLRKTVNEYNNYGEVLDNLARKWDSLSQVQQNSLVKAFAGVHQAENFRVLMENYDKAKEYMDIAANSDGAADQKFGYYLDSLEAKTQSLKASLEALASQTIPEDLYGSLLDISQGMVDAATNTGILKASLVGLGTTGTVYALQQLASYLQESVQGFSNLDAAMKMTRTGQTVTDIQRLLDLTQGLSQSQTRLVLSTQNLTDAEKIAVLMNQGMSQAEATATVQSWGLSAANTAAAGATITLSGALKGLWATLMANPLVLVAMAVTAGVMAWQKYKQAQEEAAQALSDSLQKYDDAENSVKSLETQLEDCSNKIKELQALADNGTITLTDQEELDRLKETNTELERQLAVEKERRKLAAIDAAKEADKKVTDTVVSRYDTVTSETTSNYAGRATATAGRKVTYADELVNAINEYQEIQQQIDKLDDAFGRGEIGIDDYNAQLGKLTNQQTEARERASEMYEQTSDIEDAYVGLTTSGEKLTTTQQSNYDAVLAANQKYGDFCGTADRTKQALDGVSTAGTKAADAIDSLDEDDPTQTAKQKMIENIDSLSEGFEELDKIMESMKDKNPFDYSLLDDDKFKEAFSGCGEAYTDFIEKISSTPNDVSACQSAFNNLVTEWINSSGVMDELSEDTAQLTEDMLTNMGITNAHAVVTALLAQQQFELGAANEYAAATGGDLASATDAEIAAYGAELAIQGQLTQQTAQFLLQKIKNNGITINTAADIDNIYALAQAAGATAGTLDALTAAKNRFGSNSSGSSYTDRLRTRKDIFFALKDAQNTEYKYEIPTYNYGGGTKTNKSSSGSKSETDKYLKNFESMQKKLKSLYDNGKLTTKQYYDALRALAEKYLKDREKYADKLEEIENEYVKGMKELYDKVISGVISKINKKIDAMKDQKSAAVDALKAEQKAAEAALEAEKKAIQTQIDGIEKEISAKQEQIDAINDEADAKQRAYDLDKAQYELDRLRNQKTIYEYSGKDKGFVYKVDDKAVRDQEQEVDDKKREIKIANIEKEISVLEKRKSVLEDQQDAIEQQIDAIGNYYDQLIADTETYWDQLINGMEQTKSKWEELQELQENAELAANLRDVGIDINRVLEMTDDEFATFKTQYLTYIASMNSGNEQLLASLSALTGVDMSALPDALEQTQQYIDQLNQGIDFTNIDSSLSGIVSKFDETARKAGIATGAIVGGVSGVGATGSDSATQQGQSSGQTGSGGSLNEGIKQFAEESVPEIEKVSSAFAGSEEGEDTGTSVAGSAQKASKAISSGKDSGGEEDESLQGSIKTQVEAAVDEEEGIPKQTEAWSGLNEMLSNIKTNLEDIKSLINEISTMDLSGLSAIGGIQIGGGARVDGTAFASGTLGKVSDNGVALGGELGREMVVRNGRFFTVGDNGAELFHHKKGDIIFNHKQTQDILKNGHTNSRGKAFAGGNVNGLPKEYSLPSQEVMDRMAKLEAGFASMMNKDESLLTQMQIRDNTKKIYEQNARTIQEIQKINKSNAVTYSNTFGDIHLHDVQNTDDFARAMKTRFGTIMKQV